MIHYVHLLIHFDRMIIELLKHQPNGVNADLSLRNTAGQTPAALGTDGEHYAGSA